MRRNTIATLVLAAATLVVAACSSPVAPSAPKPQGDCGVSTGGQICMK